jgi:TIR domain
MATFSVFLSHNSLDKPSVRELKRVLAEAGLSGWLDEDELVPGENWQNGLAAGIANSDTAAICFGPAGIGPWEDEEMQALLIRAVKEKRRVIPVLLPGAPVQPEIPLFLGSRTWVDCRSGYTRENLDRLIWGITGVKPGTPPSAASAGVANAAPTAASPSHFSGKDQLAFCDRLGTDWKKLAALLEIAPADQARFERGDEARGIWVWLHNRQQLGRLIPALTTIGRGDLASSLRSGS